MHDFLHPLVLLHELNPLVLLHVLPPCYLLHVLVPLVLLDILSHLLFRLAVISSVDSVAASSPSRHTRQIILMVVSLALSLQDFMESSIGQTPPVAPPRHQHKCCKSLKFPKFPKSLNTLAPTLLSSDQCLTLVSHPPQLFSNSNPAMTLLFQCIAFSFWKTGVISKSTNLILLSLLFLSTIMWISELI